MDIPYSIFTHVYSYGCIVEAMDQRGVKQSQNRDLENDSKTRVIEKSKGECNQCKGVRRERTGHGLGRLNQCQGYMK